MSIMLISGLAISQVQVNCAADAEYDPIDGPYDIQDLMPIVTGTMDFDITYQLFTIDNNNCMEGYCKVDSIVWTVVAEGLAYNCTSLITLGNFSLDDMYAPLDTITLPTATLPIETSLGLNAGYPLDYGCNIVASYTDELMYVGQGAQLIRDWIFLDWCDAATKQFTIVFNIETLSDNIVFGANWLGSSGNSATYEGLQYGELLFDCTDEVSDSYPDIQHLYCAAEGDFTTPPALYSNENYLDGVSTLDLVLIQRHILGLSNLDSDLKIYAADVSNSGTVSAIDLVILRRLILGVWNTLPNHSSVVGIVNTNTINPYPFPYAEYTLVKIGDVNGSATIGLQSEDQSENRSIVTLGVEDIQLNKNQTYTIPVTARDLPNLVGLQSTIEWDSKRLDIVNITKGVLDIQAEDVNKAYQEKGLMSFLWMSAEANIIEEDDVLFYLHLNARDHVILSDVLSLGSTITKNVSITEDLQSVTPTIVFNKSNINNQVLAYPNPASNQINFQTIDNETVQVSLMNTQGMVVMKNQIKGSGKLDVHDVPNGVYIYEITNLNGDAVINKIVIQH